MPPLYSNLSTEQRGLGMPVYSEKVMDHFTNPPTSERLKMPMSSGKWESVCGDMMTFLYQVKDDKLEDVKFKNFGAARQFCFQYGKRDGVG
jgi:nitrogen fixation NifU-like protein